MKHTKVVSKCCEAEVIHHCSSPDYIWRYFCLKCKTDKCDTQTITLTPDSEIAEKFNQALMLPDYYHKATIIALAEQLKIDPKLINK